MYYTRNLTDQSDTTVRCEFLASVGYYNYPSEVSTGFEIHRKMMDVCKRYENWAVALFLLGQPYAQILRIRRCGDLDEISWGRGPLTDRVTPRAITVLTAHQ